MFEESLPGGEVANHTGYFLTTERLGFRSWQPEDIDLALALWGDPVVSRFIHAGGPPSPAAIEARLAREISMQAEHGIQYWPIFLLDGGAHVGCAGLRPYRPEQGILEIGVHLRPAFFRQGIAVEAARAVIAHAFEKAGAQALFAGHNPDNIASRAMLQKLGFRYTHDELYPPTGLMHPSYLLAR
jgi:[ribosomal protein S5]-alanine N-acetyltransferase